MVEGSTPVVLVIEDDPVQCRFYEHALAGTGWALVFATTLADADRALAASSVDAVLLDLFLPDGDGRSWLTAVRERPEGEKLPVIVVAGTAAVDAQVDFYALGAATVLQKPVAPALLVAALRGQLARATAARREGPNDPVTGLPTRAELARTFASSRGDRAPASSLALLEVDPEPVPTRAVEESLRQLAGALAQAAEPSSIVVARWSPSMLVALLSGFDPSGAGAVLARARRQDTVAFSAGVAAVGPDQELAEVAADAEAQLTAARLAGGDRVRWVGGEGAGERIILIAEDDDVVASLLTHRLKRDGFIVERAVNGPAAVEILRSRPLALAVLDVMMPGMDGFEVLTRLRAMPQHRRLPVIILTGLGGERDVERALALGANDYVIKPFSPVELTARVHRLLRAT